MAPPKIPPLLIGSSHKRRSSTALANANAMTGKKRRTTRTDEADGRTRGGGSAFRVRRGARSRERGARKGRVNPPLGVLERERPTRRETGGEGGKKKKRKSNAPSFDTFTPVQGFSCTPFIAPSPFVTVISFLFFLFSLSLSLSRLCVRASASSVAFSLSLSQKGGLKPGLPCVRFLFSSYGSLSLFRESRTRVYYSARRFFLVRALRSPRSGADSWREYISRLGVP